MVIGRTRELAHLDAALDEPAGSTMVISAIGGMGGIGKTMLALRYAHSYAAEYDIVRNGRPTCSRTGRCVTRPDN
jgi:hypothetical protein